MLLRVALEDRLGASGSQSRRVHKTFLHEVPVVPERLIDSRGCHCRLGQSGLLPATSLAFLAVLYVKVRLWRRGLNLRDVRKSCFFNNLTRVFAVFYRKCNDMRIFRPVQSPGKRGPPPILAPYYCWKQWGSTRQNRLAVSFFHRRIRSGNQSFTRTSGNPNGEGGQRRMLCSEAADPTLPCGALNLALAFSAPFCGDPYVPLALPSSNSCLLWLRGLSVLRFAGRSPLPDSSHKEEAGRRSSVAKEALSAVHPVPRRGGVGAWADPALAFGALIFRRKPLAGIHPPGEQRETVPGSCRAGPVDVLTDRSLSL